MILIFKIEELSLESCAVSHVAVQGGCLARNEKLAVGRRGLFGKQGKEMGG
jgi:hypothetical protein